MDAVSLIEANLTIGPMLPERLRQDLEWAGVPAAEIERATRFMLQTGRIHLTADYMIGLAPQPYRTTIKDVIDRACREVEKWPTWMRGSVNA